MLALIPVLLMAVQDPVSGISLELARTRRARIRHVGYELQFELDNSARETGGHVRLTFRLTDVSKPVVLDFSGTGLANVTINRMPASKEEVRRVHDHLVLDTKKLRPGRNIFEADFRSSIAPTGTPLTVYRDATDGKDYYYTLLVPSDAHGLFPCFDQPDLKAIFTLLLTIPAKWAAIGNTPPVGAPKAAHGDKRTWEFHGTEALPTYLFAFACGPFVAVEGPEVEFRIGGERKAATMRLWLRASKRAALDKDRLFAMHANSVRWYERYFGVSYPFSQLDFVLCPGFPYGGMEHAGAIFYRESALVFDHEPTSVELLRRSTLIYHEVAHQWFGNLVTMRWFDDLWLKEGFATHMGYSVLAELEPESAAWLRFHQRVKPAAYRIDTTAGTVPVYQSLGNLADAKSNYGAIVYNKAPAVLRELEHRIGKPAFRKGMQLFLEKHAFANADWQDLLAAFEKASGSDLSRWSARWILGPGMPQVALSWRSDDDGKVTSCGISQNAAGGGPTTPWPLRLDLLVGNKDGSTRSLSVTADEALTLVEGLTGSAAPDWILLNPKDIAYGQFLLDDVSAARLCDVLVADRMKEPLAEAVAFTALHDMVRETRLDPRSFVRVGFAMLSRERDPLTHSRVLSATLTAVQRWLSGADAQTWHGKIETLLRDQLLAGELKGFELQAFRALCRLARDKRTLTICHELRDGSGSVPGLQPGIQDRFLAAAALLAAGHPSASKAIESLGKGDVAKYRYQAAAAEASVAAKERYFAGFLDPKQPPEQWISGCLSFFHWPGQGELTLPYLERALERVEWVKANRRIFFMPAWIDEFINAHSSAKGLAVVDAFLAKRDDLSVDIRRKLLQSVDALRRAVAIKAKYR
ncbi:MAG: aminopeptidase [Planctomycetes bacterium]|jgi:aminopeptidase N|nr:aminopeptidase [Planctomycetota bacterium]MDP6423595.1 M1 family aminopeptidase [Planctomycetota bacterium]